MKSLFENDVAEMICSGVSRSALHDIFDKDRFQTKLQILESVPRMETADNLGRKMKKLWPNEQWCCSYDERRLEVFGAFCTGQHARWLTCSFANEK